MTAGSALDTVAGTDATAALEVGNLTAGYGRTVVLRDVTVSVPEGSVTALLGANGAGKSTLLRTVSGLIRPASGSISLHGHDITHDSPVRRTRAGLCHIPEGRGIFPNLSVIDNLRLQAVRGKEAETIEKATATFPILGKRLKQRAGTMSGGEQQMLAMTSAYARETKLVMVDEASLGLAPIIVDEVFASLEDLAARGVALLIVDQFAARALRFAQRAYVLHKGRISHSGTASALLESDLFERYLGE